MGVPASRPGTDPWGQPGARGGVPQAPKPGIVPLRPLGVGELLDGALGLIRSNPGTVLGLAAAVSAVSAVIQVVMSWALLSAMGITDFAPSAGEPDLTPLIGQQFAQAVPALVVAFVQVLASGLFVVLVGAAVLGRRLDAGQTWDLLRPRMWPLILVTLLLFALGVAWAVVTGGLIALMFMIFGPWGALPGALLGLAGVGVLVFAYIRLTVASPALVIEGVGPIASMRRSWELVRGSWWRVLGITLLASIITGVLAGIVSVPISLLAAVLTGFSTSLLPTVLATGLATLISGIITLPFTAAVTGLLYTDLRMRREGLDIALISAGVSPTGDPLEPYRRVR